MLRKSIARYIGYPLQDAIKGTTIASSMEFLKKSQYWDPEKIGKYQYGKLERLLEYAYANVPYYTDLFRKLNIHPGDIKSFDDLRIIPVLTKEIARKENLRLVSKKLDPRHVKTGKTGGTTGSPLKYYKDTNSRSFTWGSYYRWYEWMGIAPWDTVATFWGARTVLSVNPLKKIKDNITELLQNNFTINAFTINEESIPGIISKLNTRKPKLIKGYLSAIMEIAKYMEINNVFLSYTPVAISSTTETLLPPFRTFLEQTFKCPVYDQYGCGEISAIAYECSGHHGLHLNQEHVYVELLDDKDNPVEKNGRVVATDLDNMVMPFIRYDTGDIASMGEKECTCGVKQPKLSSIEGRSVDTIMLANGSKVHGVFFTDILYELDILVGSIGRFQVVQDKPGDIEFRIEPAKDFHYSLLPKLQTSLDSFFNNVNIVVLPHLSADPSGKFRYIISEVSSTL
jgi:phenylacetate-CoA ligase